MLAAARAPVPELALGLLLLHTLVTLALVGLIWFVQIVHYPLMARVRPEAFAAYEIEHQRRTTLVVGPLMLAEAAAALALLGVLSGGAWWIAATGVVLLLVVWTSTLAIQVPLHARLERGFDARIHGRLVGSNWLRTAAWSARGMLALWLLAAT